jgi:hypothetical protein
MGSPFKCRKADDSYRVMSSGGRAIAPHTLLFGGAVTHRVATSHERVCDGDCVDTIPLPMAAGAMSASMATSRNSQPGNRPAAIRFIVLIGVVSLFADMTYEGARSVVGPSGDRKGEP